MADASHLDFERKHPVEAVAGLQLDATAVVVHPEFAVLFVVDVERRTQKNESQIETSVPPVFLGRRRHYHGQHQRQQDAQKCRPAPGVTGPGCVFPNCGCLSVLIFSSVHLELSIGN